MATATAEKVEIRPHPGPQERALASPADIVIFGGAAGPGKTWALLIEPLRHVGNPGFSAVVFRRESPQITNPGGLWDESQKWYPLLKATPRLGSLDWVFPSGARVKFSHLEYDRDKYAWDGAQVPLIAFDQLESFLESQFWYMLSRNRSLCGVRPYLRATCNPVPEDDPVGGWLHGMLQWWIDQVTGLPVPERDGMVRWFVRIGDDLRWADSAEELRAQYPALPPKSLTFIAGKLEDNPTLTRADPGYLANLMALPLVERERLRGGNWNVRPEAGKIFNRAWFEVVDAVPADAIRVRAWDKAGTESAGNWSVGVRMARAGGLYFVEDVARGQWGSARRNAVIRQTAALDGEDVGIVLEQEPGSGGKESAEISVRELAGYDVRAFAATGDKLTRAYPLSAQAEAGNVKLVRGPWNAEYLSELHRFTGAEGGADDQVDASAGAFNRLALRAGPLRFLGEGIPEDEGERAERERTENEERVRAARESLEEIVRTQGVYWPGRR